MFCKLTFVVIRQISRNKTKLIIICQKLSYISSRKFTKTLFEKMHETLPIQQDRVKKILSVAKDKKLCDVSVGQAFGGLRGVKALICETSELSVDEGIKFRGLSLNDIKQKLPTGKCRGATNSEYPIPEAMMWLLLTGNIYYI